MAVTVAAVAGLAVAATPVAQAAPTAAPGVGVAEAPTGKQCGAYRHFYNETGGSHLRYWHCGNSKVNVEVDMRYRDNEFYCVFEWEDTHLTSWTEADNAWYVGGC